MYATVEAMIARYGEPELQRLAAEEGQLDGPYSRAVVETALRDASSRIDSYLAARYRLPLASVPAAIEAAACALARHALPLGRGGTASDAAKTERDETIAWLERLESGQARLPGAAAAGTGTGGAMTADRPRAFGAEGFRRW